MLDFSEILSRVAKPPGFHAAAEDIPPYSAQEIQQVVIRSTAANGAAPDLLNGGDAVPPMVYGFDSRYHWIALLVLRSPPDAEDQVVFPSAWPIDWGDRGPIYLMWSFKQWKQAADYHGCNWLLPVVRQIPVAENGATVPRWRWGLIDIVGGFVLPCQFPSMGFPENSRLGKPIQADASLQASRREPWCWVWVGEAEHAKGCLHGDKLDGPGDVIEVWSGMRPLPQELTAQKLDHHFALVCKRAEGIDGPIGLFNLATGRCGPICWRYIHTCCLHIRHATPAQCFDEAGLWTYVGENGEAWLPADFARAEPIDSGLATVQLGLAQADALGLTLTLPDGSRQGPVGVFGPRGAQSLGQWFLPPRWRDVLGEYDGHFVVQNTVGEWGMVTPEGDAVTRFLPRNVHHDITRDVFKQVIYRFKRAQKRRFLRWLNAALEAGSLGVMANKLRSSFGRYDYGTLPCAGIPVRLIRDVMPLARNAADDNQPAVLSAESQWVWHPGQRNYFVGLDLRTHCAIGERSESGWHGYDDVTVPWDALALDLPPCEFGSDTERRQFECLKASAHLQALDHLLEVLCPYIDLVDCESVSAFHPALEAANNLHMSLLCLLEITALNNVVGRREMMNSLPLELAEIGFPNVQLSLPENDAPVVQPSVAHDAPLWIKPPELQAPWSEAVHAAHQQALKAFRVWEGVYQRCIGIQ